MSAETPTRIAEAFVPLADLTAKGEIPILTCSKRHVLEAIPIVVPARWIAEIPVVFVLPQQSIGRRTVGAC